MKKIKIIIINRARNVLYVEYQRCGQSDVQRLKIKKRKVLRMLSGHYIFSLGYDSMNLLLSSELNGIKDREVIESIGNPKHKGVRLLVNNPSKVLRLKCNEKLSVAALIENLA